MKGLYNRNILIGIIVLLIVINIGTLATLWYTKEQMKPTQVDGELPPPRKGEGHSPPHKAEQFLERALDLTDEQVLAFTKLREEHRTRNDQIHEEVRDLKKDLVRSFTTEDEELTLQVANKIGSLEAQIDLNLAAHYKDLKELCTPEQQEKLGQIFQEAMRMQKPPKGARGEGPPPPRKR